MPNPSSAPLAREARLRPDFATCYPGCPAGVWVEASTAAAYVLGQREALLGPAESRTERALDPVAWEFRGENPFGSPEGARRRRFTDRYTSGAYKTVTHPPS